MLKKMGDVTTALFSFAMALLWGWMAWYLKDFPVGKPTLYGVTGLAVLAFLGGAFSIYRSLIKPANQAVAETRSGQRADETEEEFVARMLSTLGSEKPDGQSEIPSGNSKPPTGNEEDPMVARVLAKLAEQKAAREDGNPTG